MSTPEPSRQRRRRARFPLLPSAPRPRALIVSTHIDDGVLSSGGTAAMLVAQGWDVRMATVFAGIPSAEQSSSPLALHYLQRWGTPNGVADRRKEDESACRALKIAPTWLDHHDALFRTMADGSQRCHDASDTRSAPNSDDMRVVSRVEADLASLYSTLQPDVVLTPLSVGGHLDHTISRIATARTTLRLPPSDRPQILYFEDMPYSLDDRNRREHAEVLPAVAGAMALLADAPAWEQKLDATAQYASQVRAMFGSQDWRALMSEGSRSGGAFVERAWQPSEEGLELLASPLRLSELVRGQSRASRPSGRAPSSSPPLCR